MLEIQLQAVSATSCSLTFFTGTVSTGTALTGIIPVGNAAPTLFAVKRTRGLFETAAGEALSVHIDAANGEIAEIDGFLRYVEV